MHIVRAGMQSMHGWIAIECGWIAIECPGLEGGPGLEEDNVSSL
jgi:hypothetical protein